MLVRSAQASEATTDNYEIVNFAGLNHALERPFIGRVANAMA